MSSFLLDTNAIIAYVKGDEKLNLLLFDADELYVPDDLVLITRDKLFDNVDDVIVRSW